MADLTLPETFCTRSTLRRTIAFASKQALPRPNREQLVLPFMSHYLFRFYSGLETATLNNVL